MADSPSFNILHSTFDIQHCLRFSTLRLLTMIASNVANQISLFTLRLTKSPHDDPHELQIDLVDFERSVAFVAAQEVDPPVPGLQHLRVGLAGDVAHDEMAAGITHRGRRPDIEQVSVDYAGVAQRVVRDLVDSARAEGLEWGRDVAEPGTNVQRVGRGPDDGVREGGAEESGVEETHDLAQ